MGCGGSRTTEISQNDRKILPSTYQHFKSKDIRVKCKGQNLMLGFGGFGCAGVESFFDELAYEHKITPGCECECALPTLNNITSFFSENSNNTFSPRGLVIDVASSYLHTFPNSQVGKLFNKSNVINIQGSVFHRYSSNFYGKFDFEGMMQAMKSEVEKCDSLNGVYFASHVEGGVGSGIFCHMLQQIGSEYAGKFKFANLGIPLDDNVAEYGIYNFIMSTHQLAEYVDLISLIANPCLIRLSKKMQMDPIKLTGMTMADVTSGDRSSGRHNADLKKLARNLQFFPRMKWIAGNISRGKDKDQDTILQEVFDTRNSLARVEIGEEGTGAVYPGKLAGSSTIYRGNFTTSVVEIFSVEKFADPRMRILSWLPQNVFTSAFVDMEPRDKLSAIQLNNDTGVSLILEKTLGKFNRFYEQRLKIAEYVQDGMEEGELVEAREDVLALEKDYEELGIEATCEECDDEEC